MKEPPTLKKMYFRVPPDERRALKRLVATVSGLGPAGDVTQEELVIASWLWMASMDTAALAASLAPHVATVRQSTLEAKTADQAEGASDEGAYEDASDETTARVIRTTPPKGAPVKGPRKGRGGAAG